MFVLLDPPSWGWSWNCVLRGSCRLRQLSRTPSPVTRTNAKSREWMLCNQAFKHLFRQAHTKQDGGSHRECLLTSVSWKSARPLAPASWEPASSSGSPKPWLQSRGSLLASLALASWEPASSSGSPNLGSGLVGAYWLLWLRPRGSLQVRVEAQGLLAPV